MNDYERLVEKAAEGIRENGVIDLVTQAEAADAGYDIGILTRDAQGAAQLG
ncbi:hypothetical protein QUC32_22980 [Novosphingobium resinovorum]|uniref:hypothetical protein n=1 Tax=Novosphingobium TaxID=165696 RepID=UPI001B3C7D37|nr:MULTISPECIES: hypothetical protein [Novosphingobium]MBF7012515.1 hypothetical protein [Novosphingobium sp. HR1a]WJM27250.1 hypothetical protein QUC32_22980 [Novosphingobium resinovorum]